MHVTLSFESVMLIGRIMICIGDNAELWLERECMLEYMSRNYSRYNVYKLIFFGHDQFVIC